MLTARKRLAAPSGSANARASLRRRAAAAACALVGCGSLAATLAYADAPVTAESAALLPASASLESITTTPTPDTTPTPTPEATPTALFAGNASWGVKLNLPAQPSDLLAVGFHQASGRKVLKLSPAGKCLRIYGRLRTRRLLKTMPGLKLFQQALRGRGTSNFSAADCAVRPKSVILAPVTGTVTRVKNYRLYGVYRDVQLEILPDGAPLTVRVVVLHIQDPQVLVGYRVVGGVTPIATVRHFRFQSTVNRYLPVKYADHAHVQVNRK